MSGIEDVDGITATSKETTLPSGTVKTNRYFQTSPELKEQGVNLDGVSGTSYDGTPPAGQGDHIHDSNPLPGSEAAETGVTTHSM